MKKQFYYVLLPALCLIGFGLACHSDAVSDDDASDDESPPDDDAIDDDSTPDDDANPDDDSIDDDTIDDDTTPDDDAADDDGTPDDDTTPDDDDTVPDDDAVDDDAADDDTTPDDDAVDDDTIPDDDSADDDTIPDDDAADDDTAPDDDTELLDIEVEFIDGPSAGSAAARIVIGPDDTKYVLARRGHTLFLYTLPAGAKAWSAVLVAEAARDAGLAVDTNGFCHVAYLEARKYNLMYGINASGSWNFETVDATGVLGHYATIGLDPQNRPHIAYYDWANADLKYAAWNGEAWDITVVDADGEVGIDAALAVDTEGHDHIIYRKTAPSEIRVATNENGAWETTVIETLSESGGGCHIAVQPEGTAHVCYYVRNANGGTLHYAENSSGAWAVHAMTAAAYDRSIGASNDIALAPDGTPYMAASYYYSDVDSITYAIELYTYREGGWLGGALESDTMYYSEEWRGLDYIGSPNAVAIDAAGAAHLVYGFDGSAGDGLRYATSEAGEYVFSFVDSQGGYCDEPAMTLDAAENVHVSYKSELDFRYAFNTGGVWDSHLLYTGYYIRGPFDYDWCYPGNYSSIAAVGDGVEIAQQIETGYKESRYEVVEYALAVGSQKVDTEGCGETAIAAMPGGTYAIAHYSGPYSSGHPSGAGAAKDSYGDIEIYNSPLTPAAEDAQTHLAFKIGPSGVMHLVYYAEDDTLHYASTATGAWVSEKVTAAVPSPWPVSPALALDADEKAHLSFYDYSQSRLCYATNQSDAWEIEIVECAAQAQSYSSLVLDTAGEVYIAYYDQSAWAAKFAVRANGEWVKYIVDYDAGAYMRMAIDSADNVHLVYLLGGALYHAVFPISAIQ